MSLIAQIVQFPTPSKSTLIFISVGFALLLAAACFLAVQRRRNAQRRRTAFEWRSVREMMKERGFSPEETRSLEALINKHCAKAPLRAATSRQDFDRCVEAEMNAVEKKSDAKAFSKLGTHLTGIRSRLALDQIPVGQPIRSSRELHGGQWISVSTDIESVRNPQWFRMMVNEVNEAHFYLINKEKGGPPPKLKAGDRLRCRLLRDEDARYHFSASVAGYDEPPPEWRMNHTSDLSRIQSRAHFRVRHDQATTFGVLNAPVDGNMEKVRDRRVITRFHGRITSLSAGGCALVTSEAISKNVLLRVNLDLGGDETIEIDTRIVAVSAITGGRSLVRACFVGLDDEQRDKIAKHVLQRQQVNLKAKEETKR